MKSHWLALLGLSLLFAGFSSDAHAARVGDIMETRVSEQALRFFTFKDPSLRYALLGSLFLGLGCGLLGTFVVVRRMALFGDTISHAVLPGVALGFMWNMTKDPIAILIGATAVGLFSTFVVNWIKKTTRIREDAALGMVLASFFAVGICMISMLPAEGTQSGIRDFFFGQAAAISKTDVILMGSTAVLSIILVTLFFKTYLASSFDLEFARASGIPVTLLNGMLMLLLAFSIVVALQAVGAVLVSALLITPAATAYLLTDRLHRMLIYSAIFGMTAAALGAFLSFLGNNLPTGPFMVLGASCLFASAFFFAPKHGLLARMWRQRSRSLQIRNENTLKSIYHVLEKRKFEGDGVSFVNLATQRRETLEDIASRIPSLRRRNFVTCNDAGDTVYFTPEGYRRACRIVRNHRLWELYLTNAANYPADHVHDDAEKIEHILGEDTVRELERQLHYPNHDPHGKAIPSVQDMLEMSETGPNDAQGAVGYGNAKP